MGLLSRWRPNVTIIATPEDVRFVSSSGEVHARPLVRVHTDGRLIAVGPAAEDPRDGGRLVRLFERPPAASNLTWFNSDACARFFNYHMALATHSSWLIGPIVNFHGLHRFRRLFNGREAEHFGRMLRDAGAARVTFVDS